MQAETSPFQPKKLAHKVTSPTSTQSTSLAPIRLDISCGVSWLLWLRGKSSWWLRLDQPLERAQVVDDLRAANEAFQWRVWVPNPKEQKESPPPIARVWVRKLHKVPAISPPSRWLDGKRSYSHCSCIESGRHFRSS